MIIFNQKWHLGHSQEIESRCLQSWWSMLVYWTWYHVEQCSLSHCTHSTSSSKSSSSSAALQTGQLRPSPDSSPELLQEPLLSSPGLKCWLLVSLPLPAPLPFPLPLPALFSLSLSCFLLLETFSFSLSRCGFFCLPFSLSLHLHCFHFFLFSFLFSSISIGHLNMMAP